MIPKTNHHRLLRENHAQRVTEELATDGYSFVSAGAHALSAPQHRALDAYREAYSRFPLDNHLNSGEGRRTRRYARFQLTPKTGAFMVFPHAPFFQSADFDELYGDIDRFFAPLTGALLQNRFFLETLVDDFYRFPLSEKERSADWEVSAHLIRIAAEKPGSHGRPAPEGIHQDGYHFGVARLFSRVNLAGGESRVHDLAQNVIDRKTLREPLEALYMNDRAIYHSVEPFVRENPGEEAYRDVLIALYQPLRESPQKRDRPLPLDARGRAEYLARAQESGGRERSA